MQALHGFIHRSIVRERGIALAGPAPHTLIDPVTPADLQQAIQSMLPGRAARILREPAQLKYRGSQSYVVLTLCRALYAPLRQSRFKASRGRLGIGGFGCAIAVADRARIGRAARSRIRSIPSGREWNARVDPRYAGRQSARQPYWSRAAVSLRPPRLGDEVCR
jgi:hypothetical protein